VFVREISLFVRQMVHQIKKKCLKWNWNWLATKFGTKPDFFSAFSVQQNAFFLSVCFSLVFCSCSSSRLFVFAGVFVCFVSHLVKSNACELQTTSIISQIFTGNQHLMHEINRKDFDNDGLSTLNFTGVILKVQLLRQVEQFSFLS
jgi:hypothetical protein